MNTQEWQERTDKLQERKPFIHTSLKNSVKGKKWRNILFKLFTHFLKQDSGSLCVPPISANSLSARRGLSLWVSCST